MRKFNRAKLLSILVMAFTFITFMPTVCNAEGKPEDTNLITMKVSYGIEGNFKGSTGIPVNIEIENNGESIEGQVEVRVPTNTSNTYDAFVEEVNLTAKEKRTVTIPINLPENFSKIAVVFTQGNNILKENKVIVSNGRVNDDDMLMGILTDNINGLSVRFLDFSDLNNKGNYNVNKAVSVSLNLDSLLKSDKNISELDVIVINNYNISNLQNEQYKNLSTWINNGGTLIIGSGENASKTIGNISKEFLDLTYDGTKDINGYTLANLRLKDGNVKLQEGENPLIYSLNKGRGKIYISTFDLSNKNIASKDNIMKIWKQSLGDDFVSKNNNRTRNGNYVVSEIDNLSTNVPNKENFKIEILIIVFIAYSLLVGIIIYLVMKKLNKRELLWGVIPAIAIIFSLLLYLVGANTRIKDLVLNQLNIIVMDESGTSEVSGYVGIGSKYKDDLIVQEPVGSSIQAYDNNNNNFYRNDNMDKSNPTKLGTKTVYRENNTYYEFKDLSALEMKKFEISGHKEIVPKIEVNLNYDSQKLVGKIKNTLGYDIEKLLVVSSSSVWDIGEIKTNDEKQVEVTNSASGLNQYADNLNQNYYNNKNSNQKNQNKEKFKNILRISSLVRGIDEGKFSNKSTYLVAITDMPIDYGFDFSQKSVSKYDTTGIVQEINIDFTDAEGNLNYPLGYFKGEITQADSNINIDLQNNHIYGSGTLVLDYLVDQEIDLLDLKVGYIDNQNSSRFKGTTYIYNYERNDYDKINYKAKGESIKNPSVYIKDGKVIVKLTGSDEDGIGIPQIAVKGRVK